jgi:hypothetical protein
VTASPSPLRRWWDRSRARREGRRDGLLGVPAHDEVAYPPALLAIKQRADEALASHERAWASRDAGLIEAAEVADRRHEVSVSELRADREALADAEARCARAHDVGPDPWAEPQASTPRIGRGMYAVVITAILVAEFPLNAIAFRLFGEGEVLTWVMTAGLAATLILCAHGLGAFLRAPHPTFAERRWIIVLLALPTLTIVAIAVIRARYLSLAAETTGFDGLGPVAGSGLFLVINLLVYAGATMLSYLAHAPGRRLRSEPGPEETAERAVATAASRHEEATARADGAIGASAAAARARDEVRRVATARAHELRSYHEQLMALYCTANLRARRSPEVPSVLRELPTIAIPGALLDDGFQGTESGNGRPSERTVASLGSVPTEAGR